MIHNWRLFLGSPVNSNKDRHREKKIKYILSHQITKYIAKSYSKQHWNLSQLILVLYNLALLNTMGLSTRGVHPGG